MQYIREVLRRGISLCNMPGASRVLANTGTALCACQDKGSKQAFPFESSLSFHLEGQHSLVSGIVEWKKTVHFVLDLHTVAYKMQRDTQTGRFWHKLLWFISQLALPVSSHADSFVFLCLDLKISIFEISAFIPVQKRQFVCGPHSSEK